MLSEGATSALDASVLGMGCPNQIRTQQTKRRERRTEQRDGRGESDGKYAAKRNNRHQMPGKGTKKRENERK